MYEPSAVYVRHTLGGGKVLRGEVFKSLSRPVFRLLIIMRAVGVKQFPLGGGVKLLL